MIASNTYDCSRFAEGHIERERKKHRERITIEGSAYDCSRFAKGQKKREKKTSRMKNDESSLFDKNQQMHAINTGDWEELSSRQMIS